MILDSMHDCLPDTFELTLSTGKTVQHSRRNEIPNSCNFSGKQEGLILEWPDLRYLTPHTGARQSQPSEMMFDSVDQHSSHKM